MTATQKQAHEDAGGPQITWIQMVQSFKDSKLHPELSPKVNSNQF